MESSMVRQRDEVREHEQMHTQENVSIDGIEKNTEDYEAWLKMKNYDYSEKLFKLASRQSSSAEYTHFIVLLQRL